MDGYLADRIALVTGGSRGIGRAACVELARAGAKVFVNFSSSPDAAEQTVRLCRESGGAAEAIGFNVGDSAAVDKALDSIKSGVGRLDILVNNAGLSIDGLLLRYKNEDWDRTLAVNLSGAFYCARAAAKLMLRSKAGRIINISSVVGEMGNAGQSAYVASKAGLIGLTKSLARELGMRGITVNCVAPGFIETDMTAELSDKIKNDLLSRVPLERLGQAHEVAWLVAFLASDKAAYITGQVLGINGGLYM